MKSLKPGVFVLLLFLFAGCYVSQPMTAQSPPPPPPPVETPPPPPQTGYQTFYDELAPYGIWIAYPRYGYVWSPNVEPGFRPYVTDGYWAYSDAGWTWVSYYNWGWAPFHYGRWFEDPEYGWMWVPGNDWAPAWVAWGNYNGYYGWAPLEPAYPIGGGMNPPISYWCFTDARYMGARDWNDHYYVANNNRIIMNNTTYIENINNVTIINNTSNYNNRAYNAGPGRQEVENSSGRIIQPIQIRENNQPGKSDVNNGSLNIYRPRLSNTNNTVSRPANSVPLENARKVQRAPARQQGQSPQNEKPAERTGNPTRAAEPNQQQEDRPAGRPGEMQHPVVTPQQAPRPDNNQAQPRTGGVQVTPSRQQRPQQVPNNYQAPGRGNATPGVSPKQQRQPVKGGNKQTGKPLKQQPANSKQDQNTDPKEKSKPQ